jgi:PAS domain S-box-containing protein
MATKNPKRKKANSHLTDPKKTRPSKVSAVIHHRSAKQSVKRAEEALQEIGERFRLAFENANIGMCLVDLQGRLTKVNHQMCEIFGYSQEELEGMTVNDIAHPEDLNISTTFIQRATSGEIEYTHFEKRYFHKDGHIVWGAVSSSLVRDPQGVPRYFISHVQDITKRKKTEEALRSERDKFRGMLSAISDGVDIINKNYIIEFQNKLLREYYGDRVGEKCYAAYMGLKRPCNFCCIQEAIGSGNPRRIELVAPNGKNYELSSSPFTDVDGEVKVIELVRDITERKRAEEALRQESLFRSAIIDHVTEGLCVCHETVEFPHVAFTAWNDRMIEITGYTMNEINRLGWYQTMYPDPEIQARAIERMARMRQGDDIVGEEWEITRADGEKRLLSISTSVLQTGDGIAHVLALMQDITERKQAEETLRQSEEKYRTILENIEDSYYEVDLTGNFTFLNDSACRLLGYSKDELMGINNRQYTDEENANKLYQAFNKVYKTGEPTKGFDWEIIRKDGTKRYIEASVSLMKNKSGQPIGFRGIVRDITERKRAEEALRESEERYRTILENIEDGYYEVDLHGDFTFFNDSLCRMLGYSRDEMLGMGNQKYTDEENRKKLFQAFNEVYRTGKSTKGFGWEVFRKDGTKLFGEVSVSLIKDSKGQPIGFRGIARDITERKQAEEALQAEKQKFQTLSEQAPFGLMMINKDGAFEYINPKFKELFGYDLSDVPDGRTWFRKAYPDPTYRHHVISDWINDLESSMPGEKRSRVFTADCKDGTKKIINFISVQLEKAEQLVACEDITERNRAEKALQESEEKYRQLADFLPEMVYESDKNGKILFANRCAFEAFGHTQEDFDKGITIFEMVISEDRGRVKQNFQMLLEEKKLIGNEYTALRKDHTTFPVIASANVIIQDNKPVGVRGVVIDITERKRAEEALKESEEKYRLLVENAVEAIFVAQDGMLKFANRKTTEMIGYSKEELTSKPFPEFIHPDDRMLVLDRHLKRLQGEGSPSVYPFRIVHKSGNVKWVELNTVLITWEGRPATLNFLSDITERKEAEEALQESEKKFRVLTETAASGIFIHHGGRFIYVNPASEAISGYTREELLAMNFWDLLHPDFRELIKQRAQARQQGELVPSRYELKIITKNGEERWIDLTVGMINFEGKPAVLGTDFDITERKRAEEEMRALEEQLRQSQKMEAVGLLAGGIAHDFNNLLTIIKGYSQLSLLELKEGDLLKGNIEEIQKATERAANLTGQLLAFSRRQVMQMKVFDFNTLLRDLENMLRRVIGEDIELVTILADDLGRTKTDPGQIEQVIMNLAVNARDAMPSGGKLIIETANVEFDEPYAYVHIAMAPGRYVMLSVSDTGVGMTPEVRERVFEPFFTTKEKGKGTGLGLSTVYGIVKQSGGNIWVYSEPGQGTTVKIYFPRVEEENDALFQIDSAISIPQGSETVLVVEDEPSVRSLATHIIRHQGYRVLEAADGEEALRVAQECFGEINLLLTDVVMPRMGGKELADRLKTLRPSVKVLFISGFPDEAIARHGVLTPGIAFLQKPFSPAALAQKVREVLDREVK